MTWVSRGQLQRIPRPGESGRARRRGTLGASGGSVPTDEPQDGGSRKQEMPDAITTINDVLWVALGGPLAHVHVVCPRGWDLTQCIPQNRTPWCKLNQAGVRPLSRVPIRPGRASREAVALGARCAAGTCANRKMRTARV